MKRTKLTAKQAAFVKWYLSEEVNQNATEAAARAGYKGKRSTQAAMGLENLEKPLIAAAIAKGLQKATQGAEVTVENVLNRLTRIGARAEKDGNHAAAIRCAELHGKYLKMWTERIEHIQSIEEMPLSELTRIARQIMEAGNVNLRELLAADGPNYRAGSGASGDTTTH
jgi:phage terminase small subunit